MQIGDFMEGGREKHCIATAFDQVGVETEWDTGRVSYYLEAESLPQKKVVDTKATIRLRCWSRQKTKETEKSRSRHDIIQFPISLFHNATSL